MNAEPVAIRRPVEAVLRPESAPPTWPPPRSRAGRLARLAKYALPLAAVGLAGLIFAWARINPVIERLQLSDTELAPEEIDAITMENARFAGVDAKNRAFDVTAARAVQAPDDANRIQLQRPKATIVLASGTRLAIESDVGNLQRNTQLLDLSGAVTLVEDRGYRFLTNKAQIDLDNRTANGDAPVQGSGPQGEIRAEGFQIADDGARVMFTGRSHAVFRPEQEPDQP